MRMGGNEWDRKAVYELIDCERDYQDEVWPNSKELSILDELVLLKKHLWDFEDHYQNREAGPYFDIPDICMDDIRRMTTVLVRALENHGCPKRGSYE